MESQETTSAGAEQPSVLVRATAQLAFRDNMVMDHAGRRFWLIASSAALFILCISMLIGGLGPDVFETTGDYAFDCPLDRWNRTCSPSTCAGCIPVFTSNDTFTRFLDGLSELNQLFSLELGFESKDLVAREYSAYDLDVQLLKQVAGNVYQPMRGNLEHGLNLVCDGGQPVCDSLLVILEPFIDSSSYEVVISMPDALVDTEWIANIHFLFTTVNATFTVLSITARVVYAIVTIALLVCLILVKGGFKSLPAWVSGFYISRYSPVLTRLDPGADLSGSTVYYWQYEQRAALVLLLSLVIYSNPFMPFDLIVHNWFTSALSAFTVVQFEAVVLGFVLITFGRFHTMAVFAAHGPQAAALRAHGWWFYLPKAVIVTLLAFLMWLTVVLVNAELANDPVRAWNGNHAYAAFVFVVELLWVVTLVYTLVVVVLAGIKIRVTMPFYRRYSVLSAVTAIYLFCISFAALTGNLRPTTSFAFLFFFALRAMFVFTVAVGSWPLDENRAVALSFAGAQGSYTPAASSLLASSNAPLRTYNGSQSGLPIAVPVATPVSAQPVAATVTYDDDGYAELPPDELSGSVDDDDGLLNVPLQPTSSAANAAHDSSAHNDTGSFPSAAFSAAAMSESRNVDS
ncbi:uncharacterized protein AMSG_00845 [Thecamonas trahens ATCC 50062]|uniref:Wntless-like transmembrane domain-containing protein n=1 Tax=Thecamonas trahens ATCC 50062 TaxID=461836 RepID=A0A0L0DED2_THETB|nr:hypothetical protein AMSG_00845 [Thecamonas trahens ATCC 50062]KNC50687.1 hypothetical protein AMSG_00845 [Thecamonas trahens ATCC 50062]|eukprot:XP_013762564.1 hypothetical protein AMSG_00845 [Thecamonas trahens ATCC 50062]